MKLRKRARKTLLLVLASLILLAAGVLLVTQPMFSTVPGLIPRTVDPNRLERHVRMLSKTFVPRDWAHPANLDRTGAAAQPLAGR